MSKPIARSVLIDNISYVPSTRIEAVTEAHSREIAIGILEAIISAEGHDKGRTTTASLIKTLKVISQDLAMIAQTSPDDALELVEEIDIQACATPNEPESFSQAEIDAAIQDARREGMDENGLKRAAFAAAIRSLLPVFSHKERALDGLQENVCIKGFVRDVWKYLQDAYDLVHNQSYTSDSSPKNKL